MPLNVAILGASSDHNRYAWKAQQMLAEYKHQPIPISLKETSIDGVPTFSKLADIPVPVDTVTVYLSSRNLIPLLDELIALHPRRVIFNPGAESASAEQALRSHGIEVEEACTLVLLRTGQFE